MASFDEIDRVLSYLDRCVRPSADIIADLESYSALLQKWQRIQNLVSRETLNLIWSRHFIDSLQVLSLLKRSDRSFLDLGSGGGFPALPLAIALKGSDARFVLVEPNGRKVSFLRTVARELGLAVQVDGRRSDQIDSRETPPINVITSRALAPLPQLNAMIAPFFGPSTRAILHKGREHVEELAEAGAQWHFNVLLTKSDTAEDSVLIELSDLRSI
ncbi:16S rRNA (guanine(527)-N(7))-methyltransferase RsmG [Devosia rhodophyticola]|uniref:Ribosomal RNA small subunit methyltransferase G n=1 Tax=Devosia rhodophyticola TaxID=3026423 RepID=A0ABY7Z144_9HYPH|nr:16S rRNA (guanine(527)-N(7))-methyltransferase RsmG [Devosia rhodophyticola]WDR07385.1 16S rRNA (guanine(527)-N(7))-methyltransferase RsmG [Devosia rhodophyticola]